MIEIECWKCDTMLSIRYVSVCAGASQRILLSLLARNPYKGPTREISHETGKDEGRNVREKTEEASQQKGAEGNSRQNRSVREMWAGQRGDQWIEVRKAVAKTC